MLLVFHLLFCNHPHLSYILPFLFLCNLIFLGQAKWQHYGCFIDIFLYSLSSNSFTSTFRNNHLYPLLPKLLDTYSFLCFFNLINVFLFYSEFTLSTSNHLLYRFSWTFTSLPQPASLVYYSTLPFQSSILTFQHPTLHYKKRIQNSYASINFVCRE